jgi:hypothetical protein
MSLVTVCAVLRRQCGNLSPKGHLFNLQRRAVRHPSQYSYVICDDCLPVALFLSMVVCKIRGTREEKSRLKDRWHTYLRILWIVAKSITGAPS